MKIDLSFSASVDEENGTVHASLKGDIPDEVLVAIQRFVTAGAKAVELHLAKEAEKRIA